MGKQQGGAALGLFSLASLTGEAPFVTVMASQGQMRQVLQTLPLSGRRDLTTYWLGEKLRKYLSLRTVETTVLYHTTLLGKCLH